MTKITFILPHSPQSCDLTDKDYLSVHFSHFFCKSVTDLGYDIELFYFGKGDTIKISRHKFGHKMIQFPISLGNKFGSEISLPLLRYLLKIKTDIVHIYGYRQLNILPILLILYMRQIPVVLHNQGAPGRPYSYRHPTQLIFKLFFMKADMILSVNNAALDDLKQSGIPKNKLRYVPNGVNTSLFSPESKKEARIRLGLPLDDRYLLYVGRILRYKGIEYLLDAIKSLKDSYPDLKLILVGDGADFEEFKELSENTGIGDRVKFIGYVNEPDIIRGYYNASDICVFPSTEEGFGIVTIEALACKKPVIGTKGHIGGGVLKHGENALLAEIKSAESLAENISILLDNAALRDKISSNGYDLVINNFDWKRIGEKLNDIYEMILERTRK